MLHINKNINLKNLSSWKMRESLNKSNTLILNRESKKFFIENIFQTGYVTLYYIWLIFEVQIV